MEDCYSFVFPSPGNYIDIRRYVTPDVQERDLRASEMIIRSGIVGGHQTLPEKEADVLLRTLVNNIERKYGPEVVAKMDQLGTPQLPRQDACRLVLVVYKEALALPSQYRAKVIRHLLAAG